MQSFKIYFFFCVRIPIRNICTVISQLQVSMKTQTFHALSKSALLWQIVLRIVQFVIKESQCSVDMHLIFEKWISTNSILGLFQTWLCRLHRHGSKNQIGNRPKIDFFDIHFSKSILLNPFIKNQVHIKRGNVLSPTRENLESEFSGHCNAFSSL